MASLRDDMPQTAAWIDQLRAVFGKEGIDQQIKAGINGQPTFWARENGREVGTKDHRQGVAPVMPLKIEQAADFAGKRGAK